MPTKSFILSTAGHVDHGKSALIKALTGIDPDRLPEEKARGITIDLGFAHLDLPAGPDHPGVTLQLGIVDVPGHEDFVKNMVCGVGAADAALLVVAADDGWMPQTEEHLQILNYLRIDRAVIALTKIDLVSSEADAIASVRQKLAGTSLANSPVVATSVLSGQGIETLKAALIAALADAPQRRYIGKPRLFVDRAFSLKGAGTVVTGTLIGGTLKRGQHVRVQPEGHDAKIRAIQTHNRDLDVAVPGTRVALNLPQLQVRQTSAASDASIARGDVVTLAELGSPSSIIDVVLERSNRLSPESSAGRAIKEGARVRIHHGTSNIPARICFQNVEELLPGQAALAQLRLEQPAFVFADDPFIVRDWPDRQTLAGGRVIDPQAGRAGFRSRERQENLRTLAEAQEAGDRVRAWLAVYPLARRASLLAQMRLSNAEIAEAVARLAAAGDIIAGDKIVADAGWWKQAREHATALIDQSHRDHPDHPGLPITDLRQKMEGLGFRDEDAFESLLEELLRRGFSRAGAAIGRATHAPALPPHLQSAGQGIRQILNSSPLDPPSRKQLAPDAASFQALKFLVTIGEAVEVGPDIVLARESYLRAVGIIKGHIAAAGPATVAELRQALDTTRRIMVPLLEMLDRQGITRRQGDRRALGSGKNPKLQ